MTSTLSGPARPTRPSRTTRSGPGEPRDARLGDLFAAGLPAACWAVVAGLVAVAVPVLVVWAADRRSSAGAGEALRAAGQVWLVAHGTALRAPTGVLDLTPLGLLALPLLLLARAGRHAASTHEVHGLRAAGRLTAGVALPYAAAVVLVAAACRTAAAQPSIVQAALGGAVLGTLGAGAGVLRGAGLVRTAWSALSARLRTCLVGAAGALAVLLGAGALLAGTCVALRAGRLGELAAATGPGYVGGAAFLLLGVLLVPVAAVWGACWLAGPGVAVGTGTRLGPFGGQLGDAAAHPALAALPAGGLPGWTAPLVVAVPLAAGALAGLLVRRRGGGLREAVLAGPLAGLGLGIAAVLAAGPLGGGRLQDVGPSPWLVALTVTVEVGVGAALVHLTRAHLGRLRLGRPGR